MDDGRRMTEDRKSEVQKLRTLEEKKAERKDRSDEVGEDVKLRCRGTDAAVHWPGERLKEKS